MSEDIVMYIVMRTELNMSRGKMCAQTGHAVAGCMNNGDPTMIKNWFNNDQKKIVLAVPTLKDLFYIEKLVRHNINYYLVRDVGATEVKKGTPTSLGLGPDRKSKLIRFVGSLPLLR